MQAAVALTILQLSPVSRERSLNVLKVAPSGLAWFTHQATTWGKASTLPSGRKSRLHNATGIGPPERDLRTGNP